MLTMLTDIVNLASPPARRALGRVKLVAQKKILNRLNQWTTWVHMADASAERLNQVTTSGIRKNSAAFVTVSPVMAMPSSVTE